MRETSGNTQMNVKTKTCIAEQTGQASVSGNSLNINQMQAGTKKGSVNLHERTGTSKTEEEVNGQQAKTEV